MKRLLLLCCLLILAPLNALASVSLANLSYRQCGAPDTPFALQQLAARQYHCLQASFTVAQRPARAQRLVLSALAASDIALDGVRVGMNGTPAPRAADEVQGRLDYAITLMPDQLAPGPHQLLLRLSTWHGSDLIRQQFYDFYIDDDSAPAAPLLALLLAGALAAVALLLLGLLLTYQRSARWTVFCLLCATASLLLVAEAWRSLSGYVYGWHLVRLQLVTALSGLFALLLPVYFLVGYRVPRWKSAACLLACALAAAAWTSPHFDAKAASMFMVALGASAGINLWAFRRRLSGSPAGLALALLALVLLIPGWDFFSEAGFALVVLLLLPALLFQLLRQFIAERRQAAQATRLEIQLLRKSLQPHFLMNSLSLIGELVHQSPEQADQFIEALGRAFRMLGDYADQPTIALARELELCHNYLDIMGARLQKRCVLTVGGDAAAIVLPPALLLTCLENAFSHNQYRSDLAFALTIVRAGGVATLALSMPAARPRAHQGLGTGAAYIRRSLQAAFGARASYRGAPVDGAWQDVIGLPVCIS